MRRDSEKNTKMTRYKPGDIFKSITGRLFVVEKVEIEARWTQYYVRGIRFRNNEWRRAGVQMVLPCSVVDRLSTKTNPLELLLETGAPLICGTCE